MPKIPYPHSIIIIPRADNKAFIASIVFTLNEQKFGVYAEGDTPAHATHMLYEQLRALGF
jgi:hypothetical protein